VVAKVDAFAMVVVMLLTRFVLVTSAMVVDVVAIVALVVGIGFV
jgi:hypothetical protein